MADDRPGAGAGGARPRRGRARGHRQARPARARAHGHPRRRPRPARGLSRARQDAHGAVVRAGDADRLQPDPVHARPDAVRRHRLVDLEPARRRLRVPAGPDLHEPPARRRDQPRSAEDAGRSARGDAGAPGDDRGDDASARAAVPRARDAEPDRVRGHVSAAGGTARPLPAARRLRLPRRGRRVGGAVAAPRAARGRGRARAGHRRRRRSSSSRRRSRTSTSARSSAPTSSSSSAPPARSNSTAVGASPRGSLAVLKLARCRAALSGPRLRHPRRRQGGGGAGARAPADAEAGALGAAALGGRRRPRHPRERAHTGRGRAGTDQQ